jgi:hypothetical protein
MRNESGEKIWALGPCLGVILTCEDEIAQNIRVAQPAVGPSELNSTNSSVASLTSIRSELVSEAPSAPALNNPAPSRPHSHPNTNTSTTTTNSTNPFLTLTYTQVSVRNFHKKSGIESPIEKLNEALPLDSEEWKTSPSQSFISEFDIRFRPFDLLFAPSTFKPYLKLLKECARISDSDGNGEGVKVKAEGANKNESESGLCLWNNNTLPLVYLEGGKVRVFLKSEAATSPDLLIIQVAGAAITPKAKVRIRFCIY